MNKSKNKQKDPRVFLGFAQPPLHSAAEWICKSHKKDSQLDLGNCLVVLPTSRAMQRLLQLIVKKADDDKLILTPPILTTIGGLPEFLYDIENPLASDLCQQLAWSKAIQQTPPWKIQEIFNLPERLSFDGLQPYAKLISELHRRLANDVWSFRSVVREIKKLNKSFHEIKRWEVLEEVQGLYYELLNEVGLWDRQAARNVAIRRELCSTSHQIVMVGVADLNRATRSMLQQVRENVSALVAAPRNMQDRFDEFGGLLTEEWLATEINFPDSNIRIVDRAEDQAFAAAHYLGELGSEFSPDQITIGVPDPAVEPQVERSLNAIRVKHRNVKGQPIKNTPPVQLMVAVLQYLDFEDYHSFAALVRHPDMFQWAGKKLDSSSWLAFLDQYQQHGLPDKIEVGIELPFGDPEDIQRRFSYVPEIADRKIREATALNKVHAAISRLLKPLTGKPKPIGNWTKPWCNVLKIIYGDRILDKLNIADQQIAAACGELYSALIDKQTVPDEWKLKAPASQAMLVAIKAASESTIVPPPEIDAVELAGWLDLPLDDAPVMIVTGMNDENVPSSEHGHLFLPNSLCKDLGIVDNDRRFARDAYALTVITHVRKHLMLVVGRRDGLGEPLKPSRLLFADSDDVISRRASAFFAYSGKSDSRFWLGDPGKAPKTQQLIIPRPKLLKPVTSLTVTSFREYLKCPYRFYLSKVLRLDSCVEELQELDGRAFGNLIHEVLEDFGKSEIRDSDSKDMILKYLNERLDLRARLNYRGSRLPAVRVQIEQARLRLRQFAPLQAEHAREGWRIINAEEFNVHNFPVDGEPFEIRGTIDRVDVHTATGQIAIWDYKSSDLGDGPNKVHRNRDGWKDLQLPLYRHLAKEISALDGFDLGNVQLGFILLPRELDKTRFESANWNAGLLEDADRLTTEIIRKIRAGKFWPPERQPPMYSEMFSSICQDGVFERYVIDNDNPSTEVVQ